MHNEERKIAKIRLRIYTKLFQSVKNDVNTLLHVLLKEKITLNKELLGAFNDDII